MAVNRLERWHIVHEMDALHHHAGDPKEDDVEAGDQHVAGIMPCEVFGVVGPAEGGEGPEGGREPGVEDVFVAGQHHVACLRLRRSFVFSHEAAAIRAIPRRDLVPPPQLPRHAPRLDVLHPVEIGLFPGLGHELRRAGLDRRQRRLGEFAGVHIPLVGQPRFDDHARAVAIRHLDGLGLDQFDRLQRFQIGNDLLARIEAIHADIIRRNAVRRDDPRIGIEDVDRRHAMPLADLEIVEIMRRGDFHRARPEFRIGMVVGDNRDQPAGDRQLDELADDRLVAFIRGVHRHRGIAEHGFGARRRHDDMVAAVRQRHAVRQRIADMGEGAGNFAGFDLQVRNRRLQLGVPIDQPLVAIQQALVEQRHEHPGDGLVEAFVHGEAFVGPIAAGAQSAQLLRDGAAAAFLPRPYGL